MLINGEKLDINDFNGNDSFLKRNFNDNDGCSSKAKLCSDKEAESGADRYIGLLNAPECRLFFLKVMYHLPYDVRERVLESALKPGIRSPKKYFTYSARKELEQLGF